MRPSGRIVVNAKVLNYPMVGVGRYTREILRRILPRAEASGLPIEVVRTRLAGPAGHLWEQAWLPVRCRDAVLFSPSNTGPCTLGRQVVTIHDVIPLEHPEWLNWKFAFWYRRLVPRLARRAFHIIAVSEFTKRRLVETTGVSPEKVTVIPNGVDKRFCPQPAGEVSAAHKALQLPSRRYVLSLGSLAPHKNLPRLIQAWSRVTERLGDDLWLVIAGCEQERVYKGLNLQALPPRVRLTGHVREELLPALYSGAAVFVYPSIFEGFGLPVLEAMASGVPTISGNRTSLPEVVGDAGVMVDPYDVDAMAQRMQALLEDESLRSRMVARGLERVRRFSWEHSAQTTWDVLRRTALVFGS